MRGIEARLAGVADALNYRVTKLAMSQTARGLLQAGFEAGLKMKPDKFQLCCNTLVVLMS